MSDNGIEKSRIRHPSDLTQVGLKIRASEISEAFKERLPLRKELSDIQEHFGLEIATTVLLKALETIPAYRAFNNRVLRAPAVLPPELREKARKFEVMVVASNLDQSGRKWGDHVEPWTSWARSMGFTTDFVPTEPRHSVSENARLIHHYLINHPHPNRIIVTYGQGASELKMLLLHQYGIRGKSSGAGEKSLDSVRLWLNIAGAFGGVASNRYLARTKAMDFLNRYRFAFFGRNPIVLDELGTTNSYFKQTPNFPATLSVANIIGLPLRSEVPVRLLRLYHYLANVAKMGPTDGVLAFYDMIAHPGMIVPVPGMAHTLDPIKLEPIFRRTLHVFLESMTAKPATSANTNTSANTKVPPRVPFDGFELAPLSVVGRFSAWD